VLYGQLRRHLGEVLRNLAEHKECRILEGHLMPDHVHILIAIPSKYAVSQVVGYIKGKSAIHLAWFDFPEPLAPIRMFRSRKLILDSLIDLKPKT
jgi:REP element-mobilizing transposase RayT